MPSLLCLALTGKTIRENLAAVSRYRERIDLLELRADFLAAEGLRTVEHFPGPAGLPVVLTLRRERDGGGFRGSEQERCQLLGRGAGNYRYVDLEEDLHNPALEARLRQAGCRIIRSFHDFQGVPGDLARRFRNLPRLEY